MYEINKEIIFLCGQCFLGCIKQLLRFNIVFRFNPFFFEHSPNSFCEIQVWGARREIEQEKSSLFLKRSAFLNVFGMVNASIIKYKKSFFAYFAREVFPKLYDFLRTHILLCAKQAALAACVFCWLALIAARTDFLYISLMNGLHPCSSLVLSSNL